MAKNKSDTEVIDMNKVRKKRNANIRKDFEEKIKTYNTQFIINKLVWKYCLHETTLWDIIKKRGQYANQ